MPVSWGTEVVVPISWGQLSAPIRAVLSPWGIHRAQIADPERFPRSLRPVP